MFYRTEGGKKATGGTKEHFVMSPAKNHMLLIELGVIVAIVLVIILISKRKR